ncbi:hypothetical protein Q765_19730 [Flavobacterium rivuli WB 3.3-2 = DSM 21788]|uniref:HTH cro/C1-type domain-containing protein n=1 Tax=Flavobacterium rivuli WB 3.3-2 = DSM 21788 TaxID=1121895 RepID=A0A0A2M917_9FLAO|nr:helix-turn-helix transcriptional regulator [Flavobacterium rivuli]KGO84785.1 hypothetical protein Q765_19730 [Flavobacterium rivuli WB 3.3-2 = DSM 21788]
MLQLKDKRLIQFGQHVRLIREKLGLSAADVAARSYLSKKDLLLIEQGNKNFGFTTLLELCKGLGLKPDELLSFEIEL